MLGEKQHRLATWWSGGGPDAACMDDAELPDFDMGFDMDDAELPDFDMDFDMDFGMGFGMETLGAAPEPRQLDLHSIVMAGEAPQRVTFSIFNEAEQASALEPPAPGRRLECISGRLGFSSIAVIDRVAREEVIEELSVATFNVSVKRMRHLEALHHGRRILRGRIVTSDVKGGRDPYCRDACQRMGWGFREMRNHAKLILMRTATAHHVVRTSSNLNENPRIETYTWDNDEATYSFYARLFDELFS